MKHTPLKQNILSGYIILVAVICSMAAILVHERGRMREIEAESAEIQNVGEGVIGWDKADLLHYHDQRLRTDSLLQALKPHCREYVRPAQIDTLRFLLADKEAHLRNILDAINEQNEADSLLVNHLPEVARRATRIRTVKQKKSGLAGVLGGKTTGR